MSAHDSADKNVDEFDYVLPTELIAQIPLAERDASRMLVVERASRTIHYQSVLDLPNWLQRGDLLVVNNTKVLPARIIATKEGTGGRVELLLLHRDPSGIWTSLAKPSRSLKPGARLLAHSKDGNEPIVIEIVENRSDGEIAIRFGDDGDRDLDRIGFVPLPPYIHEPLLSSDRYQTLYAQVPGSAAAPTAGLHITNRLRDQLAARGVGWAEVTLHIGLDTFRPVNVEYINEHKIHREWCSLSPQVAARIQETTANGGRVVAVGTTSARTLETWATETSKSPQGLEGWAEIFITPGYEWKSVNALLTNFHLPRSTLLMMVSSFAGMDLTRAAYSGAIEHRYRFFSFGDAMLLL